MLILAVESSCDETAVALVRDGRELVTDQVFSQADLHAVYGGVVPEIASRSHVEVISLLAERALQVAGLERKDIDAVAVTYAPGLIGALLVGVNFAKAAAMALGVPLIPAAISPPTISPFRSWSRPSCAWPYPAETRSSPTYGTIPISESWARRGTMRRGSALTRPRASSACPIPEASPWTNSRSRATTRAMPCRSRT